jgi:hypothetical protein
MHEISWLAEFYFPFSLAFPTPANDVCQLGPLAKGCACWCNLEPCNYSMLSVG